MNQTHALGHDSIGKLLFKFSIPAIVGTMVNATYNLIDRIFIGQAVGEVGLAAVTVAFPIMLFLMGSGMLIGYGTNSLISIKLGEKKIDDAEGLLGQAVLIFIILWLVLIALLVPNLETILVALGATEEILSHSVSYIKVIILGNIAQSVSFGVNSFIRGEGRPKIAMITMFIGAVLNIILDPIFIFGLKMGVEGAAIATIIAQSVAALWVLHYFVTKRGLLRLKFSTLRIHKKWVGRMLAVGAPMFVMHSFASIIQAITNIQVEYHGGELAETALSAMGVIYGIYMVFFMPMIGLAQGMQPIVGYNYGAKQFDRVKAVWLLCIKIASVIGTGAFLLFEIFPEYIFPLFISGNSEFIEFGSYAIRRFMFAFPLVGFLMISSNYFQSTGRPKKAIIINVVRQVVILIPLLLVLPPIFGIDGVIWATPMADLVGFALCLYYVIGEFKYLDTTVANQGESYSEVRI
ncbi:MAG: MATE family efflux transporter [Bacteriovoracaceae bacterium]|nr:MATE family efflux transporter [Bacteriovoracaceae bacterium]